MSEGIVQGTVVKVKVVDIKKFGAFVKVENSGEDGFVHISKVSKNYVKNITDFLEVGKVVEGKVIGKTKDGKLEISLKDIKNDAPVKDDNFEKRLSMFLKDSDRKISEFRRSRDKKRGGKKR
ncbi:RNA-binding protein [Tepiditoga spiralis]|uniref:RNA-binding protein n=1 Tax=Tepiditoga spiralis TaxID=2108365 RepID=A0A7G1G631_9BACT|nr:S1 RNA-binding domain-containing protein [Tepiditoga spiralis]BBE30554.1 RNA-binding protein [Tepiditoga spiralis]